MACDWPDRPGNGFSAAHRAEGEGRDKHFMAREVILFIRFGELDIFCNQPSSRKFRTCCSWCIWEVPTNAKPRGARRLRRFHTACLDINRLIQLLSCAEAA
jgi:hypothetical protein